MNLVMDAIIEFITGMFAAYLAVSAWERVQLWWAEGKQDLKVDYVEHDDPIVQRAAERR